MNTTPTERPASAGLRSVDIGLGLLGGTLIAVALLVVLFGDWSATDGSSGPSAASAPSLFLDGADAREGGRVVLRFRSSERLGLTGDGWGVGAFHIHVEVDGVEYMPARGEIREVGRDEYEWLLRGLGTGTRTLRLFWSDASHRPIEEGASDRVTVPLS
jgi:hypothetical protein